ncbi:uncharacterized protein [Palaemon carinicauda]|uniref:uncharacterized protein n=1 Tax=Palaemon carinicauda TaxID=392227 RepID=UPI0035B64FA9
MFKLSYNELGKMQHNREKPEAAVTQQEASKRGEHIINNNIRRVFKDVVTAFLDGNCCLHLDELRNRLPKGARVLQAIDQPLPPSIDAFIENLSVHMSGQVTDENSALYGEKIKILRNAVVLHMSSLYRFSKGHGCDDLNNFARNGRDIIYEFLGGEYYIDKRALSLWKPNEQQKMKYDAAKKEVEKMFLRLEDFSGHGDLSDWVKEIHYALTHP